MLIVFLAAVFYENHRIQKLHDEYSKFRTDDEIYGTILHIKKEKGISFVTLDSGKFIVDVYENPDYRNEFLQDHIHLGDSIYKGPFSDTIFVFHEEHKLFFIHWRKLRELQNGARI